MNKSKITLFLLTIVVVFLGVASYWFYQDSKTLYKIKEESQGETNKVNEVSSFKSMDFQLKNDLVCNLLVKPLNFDTNNMIYTAYQTVTVDIKNVLEEKPIIKFNFLDQDKNMTFENITKIEKENSIIIEYYADSGESNLLTLIKDTGFITFFSTSQKSSIATEAIGYCK